MKDRQASATAFLIAASLVLMEKDPAYAGIVSPASAELAARVLANRFPLFLKLVRRPWFWRVATMCQRMTIPGILRHYALRKKYIAQLACQAAAEGIAQIAILGAGFDGLAIELRRKFPQAAVWEIDHPATQRGKVSVLNPPEMRGINFVPTDLSLTGLNEESLISAGFNRSERTLWMAEGLLMYFPEQIVRCLLEQTRKLSAPASRFIFTFMERNAIGRIRFREQTGFVDWWLAQRGEPFRWGIEAAKLGEFISPWRLLHVSDDEELRKMDDPSSKKQTLAGGEFICLAEF